MRYLKYFESSWSPELTLTELTHQLRDAGLYVSILPEGTQRLGNKYTLEVIDTDKVFCKRWPKDELDWLVSKRVIINFIKDLEEIGLVRNVDYKLYGGGLYANFVFEGSGVKKFYLK